MVVTIDNLKIFSRTSSGGISKMIPLTELYEKLEVNDDIVYVTFESKEKGMPERRSGRGFRNVLSVTFADNLIIRIFQNGIFTIIHHTKSGQYAKEKLQGFLDLINSWRPQQYISVIDVIGVDEMIKGYYEDVYYSRILDLKPPMVKYTAIIRGIEYNNMATKENAWQSFDARNYQRIEHRDYTIVIDRSNGLVIALKTFEAEAKVKDATDFLLRVLNN